jgi:hypothetical protein
VQTVTVEERAYIAESEVRLSVFTMFYSARISIGISIIGGCIWADGYEGGNTMQIRLISTKRLNLNKSTIIRCHDKLLELDYTLSFSLRTSKQN